MKNRNNQFLILTVGLLALAVSSCKKEWLNPAPENELVTEDTTFDNPNNAIAFVNACYTQLLTWDQSSFSWIGVTSNPRRNRGFSR